MLNLKTNDWQKLGETDPELVKLFNETPWQLATENGLLFSHKNMVYNLRYLSNEVYIYKKCSSLSQTLERIYYDHYKYYVNGTMYYMNKKTGEYDSLSIPLNEFVKSDIQIWRNNSTVYMYAIISVIIAFYFFRKLKQKQHSEAAKISAAIVTTNGHQIKSNGHPQMTPVIRFSDTEKQLLHLILEKSKLNTTTTITEINYVLGIKDKNISLQKKVRSDVMNSINEKFSFLYPNHNPIIENKRSQEDKRYFEYYINEQSFSILDTILTENI